MFFRNQKVVLICFLLNLSQSQLISAQEQQLSAVPSTAPSTVPTISPTAYYSSTTGLRGQATTKETESSSSLNSPDANYNDFPEGWPTPSPFTPFPTIDVEAAALIPGWIIAVAIIIPVLFFVIVLACCFCRAACIAAICCYVLRKDDPNNNNGSYMPDTQQRRPSSVAPAPQPTMTKPTITSTPALATTVDIEVDV